MNRYLGLSQRRSRWLPTALALGLVAMLPSMASAQSVALTTVSFTRITTNNTASIGNAVASQMKATLYGQGVNDKDSVLGQMFGLTGTDTITVGANQALFVFQNNVGTTSSITEIYFEDGTLLNTVTPTLFTTSGVSWEKTANPAALPSNNSANPDFNTTVAFNTQASGDNATGINAASERLGIRFDLLGSQTAAGTKAALEKWIYNGGNNWNGADGPGGVNDESKRPSGGLRIGLHVRDLGGVTSDSFVNIVVPEPATYAMTLTSMGMVGLIAGLRRRAARRPA